MIDSDLEENRNDESGISLPALPTVPLNVIHDDNKTPAKDIAFMIHENLENLNELTESDRYRLKNCENSDFEQVFQILSEQLNNEEIHILGKSLCKVSSQPLVYHFCKHLLVPRVCSPYIV